MTFRKNSSSIVDQLGKEEEEVQLTTRLKDELDADNSFIPNHQRYRGERCKNRY